MAEPVFPEKDGYLTGVEAFAVGNAVVELGGGRRRQQEYDQQGCDNSDDAPVPVSNAPAVIAGHRGRIW